MLLSDVNRVIDERLELDASSGIHIEQAAHVPAQGPQNAGRWQRIDAVTCVFADMRDSSQMNLSETAVTSATAYTYFIQGFSVAAIGFGAKFVQIHGDAVFALFSGDDSEFAGAATAVTWKTSLEQRIEPRFQADAKPRSWKLTAGIGVDFGPVLVRRLGAADREDKNEVWSGTVVNTAAKLAGRGTSVVYASDGLLRRWEQQANQVRRRCLFKTCGCKPSEGITGSGFAAIDDETQPLWLAEPRHDEAVDGDVVWRLGSNWCKTHGEEFCEAIVTGSRP